MSLGQADGYVYLRQTFAHLSPLFEDETALSTPPNDIKHRLNVCHPFLVRHPLVFDFFLQFFTDFYTILFP